MKKVLLLIMILLFSAFVFTGCQNSAYPYEEEISPYVILSRYYHAIMDGRLDDALNYLYFPEEIRGMWMHQMRDAFDVGEMDFTNFTIIEEEQLNAFVYRFAFTVSDAHDSISYGMPHTPDGDVIIENFVIQIGNAWRVVLNPRFIPYEMQENIEIRFNPYEVLIEDVIIDD